jgi:hypothetical protein
MSMALGGRLFNERVGAVPLWQLKAAPAPRFAAKELGSAPDVVIFSTGYGRVNLTKEWQLFIRYINPNMKLGNVSALLGDAKAFTNGTGFPGKANYLLWEELDKGLPQFDKDRSCSFACHTGVVEGNNLRLTIMDGNKPPPNDANPQTHPWLFFHATMVYDGGTVDAFPHGAPGWGLTRNCVWMPLVATHALFVPLTNVTSVSSYLLPYS